MKNSLIFYSLISLFIFSVPLYGAESCSYHNFLKPEDFADVAHQIEGCFGPDMHMTKLCRIIDDLNEQKVEIEDATAALKTLTFVVTKDLSGAKLTGTSEREMILTGEMIPADRKIEQTLQDVYLSKESATTDLGCRWQR